MSDPKTRQEVVTGGIAAAVGLGLGAVAAAGVAYGVKSEDPAEQLDAIPARYTSGSLPAGDPESTAWKQAQRVIVPLVPQQLAPPVLDEASVDEIVVRALFNPVELALLIEWDDHAVDDLDGVNRYHDAVAIQLPARAGSTPPITMGSPADPVHILQWRATWQRDIDSPTRTGVDDIFPNVVHDVMPDDILPPETAAYYWVGRKAGNPLSLVERTTPIEEIVAGGFGSTTHAPVQRARGLGVHDEAERVWRVAIGIPLDRGEVADAIRPGSTWPVAFALWRGDAQNRGSRKHYADWLGLQLGSAA